jgi:amino acid adenylation domain-containing protein
LASSDSDSDDGTALLPECIGPIPVPPDLSRAWQALAREAGTDGFSPLSICATALATRLSRRDAPVRAEVIWGAREAIVPGPGRPADAGLSLRAALREAGEPATAAMPVAAASDPVDATILVSDDGLRLYVERATTSPDAPTALCWARSFLQLLSAATGDPRAPMRAHPLFDDAERDRMLHGLNPHRPAVNRYRTMAGPFEEQAERSPDAVAVLDENGTALSYGELNQRSNRLARYLRSAGSGPGTRVGICLDRGIGQVIAIYAAVKAGAAYVPFDPELPASRLSYMLDDTAPQHVLTDAACRGRIPDGPWQVHDVESDHATWAAFPDTNPAVEGSQAALLNILYTSGSTGRPKGVGYPTDGALAHLAWMQDRYPFGPGDCAVFKTSPGFDVSIWELFWPLYHGARLVICRPGGQRDPRHLAGLVADHRVTTIFLAPTVMTAFLSEVTPDRTGALRWVLCGGEPVTERIRNSCYRTLPTATLVNCYGPTEAGTVTDLVLDRGPRSAVVPLGRPAAHFRLTLLDENLDLAPIGMPAEAYIAGQPGLAHGYWRHPGRTAERFVADPYGPPGSRMYRTGDLCRYRDDGVLEHLGRIDRQVKVRGQRVELGEIESVLAADPAVADCAVISHGSPVRLLAFVVPGGQAAVTETGTGALLERVATILPSHMIPERVVPVPRIPATVNGKIDKDALIEAWQAAVDDEREIVLPADSLEASLVEIYGRVLGSAKVSVLDSFAQLGGHSLLAFRLLDECLHTMQVQPNVRALLTGTIRDVAASIRAGSDPADPVRP